MDEGTITTGISIASVLIAFFSFYISIKKDQRTERRDRVEGLERELAEKKRELEECEREKFRYMGMALDRRRERDESH